MKQTRLTEDVHADLLILKAIYGYKSLSEAIRHEMNLAGHKREFFDYMVAKGITKEESA